MVLEEGREGVLSEKTTIRARLWVPGEAFTPGDNQPRLWLHLSDGRVLALRLGHAKLGDDAVIDPLVEALSDDLNGYRYSLELDNVGYVHVLYAAPVLPQARHWHAGFVLDPGFRHYAAGLDVEVLRLLVALERPSTPPAATGRPRRRHSRNFLATLHRCATTTVWPRCHPNSVSGGFRR